MNEIMSAEGGSASGGKTLVVFYSRTGTTKKVGEMIAQKLNADVEEIKDTVDRSGAKGYLISGRDAMKKRLTKLEPSKFNPADYDLVIIGTPVWGWNMSVPVRTYLTEQKDNFQNKVAFFVTMGGSGDQKAFLGMEKMLSKKPVAVFSATTREVVTDR
jgi:flavodoxin